MGASPAKSIRMSLEEQAIRKKRAQEEIEQGPTGQQRETFFSNETLLRKPMMADKERYEYQEAHDAHKGNGQLPSV